MTDVLIKAGRPDRSCARACYVGRQYSSEFLVASVFVVAYPTVLKQEDNEFYFKVQEFRNFAGCPVKESRISVKEPPSHVVPSQEPYFHMSRCLIMCYGFAPTSSHLGVLVSLLNLHLVTNRRQLVTLLLTIQQLKIKSVGPLLRQLAGPHCTNSPF